MRLLNFLYRLLGFLSLSICYVSNPTKGELFECSSPLGVESDGIAQIESSSKLSGHGPDRASLYNERGWCAELVDSTQYIQVNFGTVKIVTAIATRGHGTLSSWVTSYKIEYSFDGDAWFDYTKRYYDAVQIFEGNSDANTTIISELREDLPAKYIRIYPVSWSGSICMRFEVLGCSPDCDSWLGMTYEKGTPDIPDSALAVSSLWANDESYNAFQARLFKVDYQPPSGGGAWVPYYMNSDEYLQVDLGRVTQVSGVVTMGRSNDDEYVKTMLFSYSDDNIAWNNVEKVYSANTDHEGSIKIIKLDTPLYARYLRLRGNTYYAYLALRAEVVGCKRAGSRDLGMSSKLIPDASITASSYYTDSLYYYPHYARLGVKVGHGCWASGDGHNGVNEYLQVYLGSNPVPVTGIATQGRYRHGNQYVRLFSVRFSNDSQAWSMYKKDGKKEEVFSRGSAVDLVERIDFDRIFFMKYVRFRPRSWVNHPSMRVEIYGFTGSAPQIFDHSPGNITIEEYRDVTLKCRAVGDHPIETKWYKGNVSLKTTTSTDSSDLLLSNLLGTDAGGYRCEVSNSHGEDSYSFRINVRKSALSMCINYEQMNDITRQPENQDVVDVTDEAIIRPEKWYTFNTGYGKEIPEKCIPSGRCGGLAAGWLDHKTPNVKDGVVDTKICFNTLTSCCGASAKVLVRRCYGYVVYKFYEGIPASIKARVCVARNVGSRPPAVPSILTVGNGHALSDFTFEVFEPTPSVTRCTMYCINTAACLSFNYSPGESLCELNNATKAEHLSAYIARSGFHYYEKVCPIGGDSIILY